MRQHRGACRPTGLNLPLSISPIPPVEPPNRAPFVSMSRRCQQDSFSTQDAFFSFVSEAMIRVLQPRFTQPIFGSNALLLQP